MFHFSVIYLDSSKTSSNHLTSKILWNKLSKETVDKIVGSSKIDPDQTTIDNLTTSIYVLSQD